MEKELSYFFLNCVPVISYEKLAAYVEYAGSVEEVTELSAEKLSGCEKKPGRNEAEKWDMWRDPGFLKRKYEMMQMKGIRYIPRCHGDFPKRLLNIQDCPFGLFVRGKLIPEDMPSVGIIGARRCTSYGKEAASFFGRTLAKSGISVVSGMALGVDGMAGRGALSVNGHTAAVLGSGVDVCYPAENIDLYQELTERGGVISERCPGYEARAYDFPIRNRIISGLSDVLIVIEAAENSGSLITVNCALSQGKDVFALPGRVGDRMSAGSNELLKNGANVLTCPEDIFQHFGMEIRSETVLKNRVTLTREEKVILDYLGSTPADMDELLIKSSFPVSILNRILVNMEIKGAVKKVGMGYISLL